MGSMMVCLWTLDHIFACTLQLLNQLNIFFCFFKFEFEDRNLCSFLYFKKNYFKLIFFYIFLDYFNANIKNNFLKNKKIILIYFKIKNVLKIKATTF